jgi:hypothetical protein
MGMGISFGVALYCIVLPTNVPLLPWAGLNAVLVGPTALQPWIQIKPFKIVARFLLGAATAGWTLGCFTANRTGLPQAVEGALGVVTFVLLARLLWWLRETRTVSPCTTCSLGSYPTCTWNLPRLLAQVDDTQVADALVGATTAGAVSVADAPRHS